MGDISLSPNSMKEIVGVVDNIHEGALDQEIVPAVYYPFAQNADRYFGVVVRTSPGSAESTLLHDGFRDSPGGSGAGNL